VDWVIILWDMHTQLILYCSEWSLKLYSPYCQVSWAKKVFLNSHLLPVAFGVTVRIQHTKLLCCFWRLASPVISVFRNPCTPLLCNPLVILTATCLMSPVQTMESIGLLSSHTHWYWIVHTSDWAWNYISLRPFSPSPRSLSLEPQPYALVQLERGVLPVVLQV